jgi:hypothetical protein
MMAVSEKMHQRTCQQQQVGQRGKGVTRMRRQQVDAKRSHHKRYDQPRPGAEKTIERIHWAFPNIGLRSPEYRAVLEPV